MSGMEHLEVIDLKNGYYKIRRKKVFKLHLAWCGLESHTET